MNLENTILMSRMRKEMKFTFYKRTKYKTISSSNNEINNERKKKIYKIGLTEC